MATDSVEKLKKEIASLEARRTELARKTDTATQRHTELESHRPALLTRIEGGDESARRDLRRIDNARLNASEDIQACRIVAADISAKLESAKKGLVRAERDAVTTALANQIDALGALENSVEGALQRLREATREIFASIDGVCGQLELLDRQRWDSRLAIDLELTLQKGFARRSSNSVPLRARHGANHSSRRSSLAFAVRSPN